MGGSCFVLADGLAAVEDGGAVEEEDVLGIEGQPGAEALGLEVADIHERDLCIGPCEQRREAAGERIAEDDERPVRLCCRVGDGQERFGAGKEDRIRVLPCQLLQIVDGQLAAGLIVIDRAAAQRVVCQIPQRLRLQRQRRLPAETP